MKHLLTIMFTATVFLTACGSAEEESGTSTLESPVFPENTQEVPISEDLADVETPIGEGLDDRAVPTVTLSELPLTTTTEATTIDMAESTTTTTTMDKPGVLCNALALQGPTFETNSAVLSEEGLGVIERFAESLKIGECAETSDAEDCAINDIEVVLSGHTDDRPTARAGGNMQLSIDRAQSVADVLMLEGIEVREVRGFAETRPTLPPDGQPETRTPSQIRQDDRRVVIELWCTAS